MFLRAFLSAYLAANPLPSPAGPIFSSPATMGRIAFFEFAPANGRGMTGECSATNPTGARGEAFSFTRATSATCTKGTNGLRTTGILTGQLVSLGSGIARQMYNASGVLGLLVEAAGTNLLLRYIAIDNAAFADVGTPALTAGQTDPKGGTTAVLLEDNDGAAYEGREQVLTVSAGVAHTMHCYVMAGTLDKARISIDGTTQNISGLLQTEWHIIERTDASSSGTSITVQVLNGNATTDTGTIIWGGCDVKALTYRSSLVETAGATGTRNAETGSFTLPVAMSASAGSHAASFQVPAVAAVAVSLLRYQTGAAPLYVYPASQFLRSYDGTTEITNSTPAMAINTVYRVSSTYAASTQTATDWAPDTTSGAFDGQMGTTSLTSITVCGLDGSQASFICTEHCADPITTRCL